MKLLDQMEQPVEFNSKILIYGDSKIGKTSFLSTFTKGPLYLDFFDPNGSQIFIKQVRDKVITGENVEFTQFDYADPKTFDNYWKHLQKLEREKFFEKLRDQNGIYGIDSYTTLNLATMAKTMSSSTNALPSQPDFRKNKGFIMNFIQTITTLPCAVVLIAHTEVSKDEVSGSVKILPMVTGSLKTSSGVFFDDLIFMKMVGKNRVITTSPSAKANAGSRVLPSADFVNLTMDDYFECHATGKVPTHKMTKPPKEEADK